MGVGIALIVGFGVLGLVCLVFPESVARHDYLVRSPALVRATGVLGLGIAIFFTVYLLLGGR